MKEKTQDQKRKPWGLAAHLKEASIRYRQKLEQMTLEERAEHEKKKQEVYERMKNDPKFRGNIFNTTKL